MFRSTETACFDCGDDAFADTDAVEGDGVTPLCFACYVERLDRIRACGIVEVGSGSGDDAEFVVGAPSVENAHDLSQRVAEEVSVAEIDISVSAVAPLTEARSFLGDYHGHELARASRSESRHIYASTSTRGTVVDAETRTDGDVRDEIADGLAEAVLNSKRVRKRKDVDDGVAETFPALSEHRVPNSLGVKRRIWERAKERGVSPESERAERNQRAGREFEEFFRNWCDERGLYVVGGKKGIVRHHPDAAEAVARKTDGLAGVPDFLVRGDGQRSFDNGWRPDGDAFVEVKRRTSRMSREQERVAAHLKALGFKVYLFRGTRDDHRFERR